MRSRVVLAVALIVVVALTGVMAYAVLAVRRSDPALLTATARLLDITDQAVASGTTSATATYGLAFGRDAAVIPAGATTSGATTSGPWTVTAVNVEVGSVVTSGQVLATADAPASAGLAGARAALDAANAKLQRDQAKPTPEDIAKAKVPLDQAQHAVDSAMQSLADAKAKGKAAVDGATATLKESRQILARDLGNRALAAIVTADRRAVTSAKGALGIAQAAADDANHKAQQALDTAMLALDAAQQTYAAATAPATPETIAADAAAIATAEQALAKLPDPEKGGRIVASADGQIIQVALVVGGIAPTGDAIQLLVGPMLATASFPESDVTAISAGQPATVTVAALGLNVTAKVTRVSVLPNSLATAPVVTYPVTVTLDSSPPQLRPGMTASVTITTATLKGVLAVPVLAIRGSPPDASVRVIAEDGSVREIPVEVGVITDTLVEIRSGIADGAIVVTGASSRPGGR